MIRSQGVTWRTLSQRGFDELTWFNVKDSFGNDNVSLDWGFIGFILSYGDDKFDGGHGADYVWTQTAPSNFELSFVKQTFVDGEIVDVELDHCRLREGWYPCLPHE
jgi:hypothetical protein